MANITLQMLFKKYIDSLKSNTEFRGNLNKEANHYFTQDINSLKSQIALVNQEVEAQFNKNYKQVLDILQREGMSNVVFTKISKTLKDKVLEAAPELRQIGIDAGHVFGNLTIASKQKAQTEIFEGFTGTISEYSQVQLTPKNLEEIGKAIALISAYTGALEELDKLQDRTAIIKFLKRAPVFKKYAASANLTTLNDIQNAISNAYESKAGVKGYSELADQLLKSQVVNLEANTVFDFSRKIVASEQGIAVTFEVKAVNQFKGQIAKALKTSFLGLLENFIADGEFSKSINDALEKSIKQPFTKQEFLSIFTKSSGSKTLEQAIGDILYEVLKTGKAKPYSANSKNLADTIKNNIKINIPSIQLKKPKAKPVNIPKKITLEKNLSNLLLYFNSHIQDVVSANMGDGSSRDILNYRTGRFAASVRVEQLTMSREGMLSAYYNYMKNPYATFSEGGRQQYPRSRDPKLLISRSIREIAQQRAITRLRAVLV